MFTISVPIDHVLIYVQGRWPAELHRCSVPTYKREYPLDSRHTHFILVDDGTKHLYSPAEANFRSALEHGLANSHLLFGESYTGM